MKSSLFEQARLAFDEIAIDGYIGDPNGSNAYAYIRVSTEEQSDSKRSGLARQIYHCHEIAQKQNLKIRWDWVYADDSSGFTFEGREGLTDLRREIQSPSRRADTIVLEVLDRLSRNADWHQGFLLDEFKRADVRVVFWKAFNSRVERAVMGAVAQDAMELAKKRMYEGQRSKARSGRVTARRAAYGYKLVDSAGNEGATARKDTHYGIDEAQAQVVRKIYQDLASGIALRAIARSLSGLYPSPTGKRNWGASTVRAIVGNPNYKGEFHAFRWSKDRNGKHVEYDDYIVVPIPAIVSEALWDVANEMLAKNKRTASRNAKQQYLLTGLVKCAECGYAYVGHKTNKRSGKRKTTERRTPILTYHCSSRHDYRKNHEIHCTQGKVGCKKLDEAVWRIVCEVLLNPSMLLNSLERYFRDDENESLNKQIVYLEQQVAARQQEDERIYRAYIAGAFDEYEFASQRQTLKSLIAKLDDEIDTLRSRVMTPEQAEEQKQFILECAEKIKQTDLLDQIPFEKKQRIIKMVVDRIELNQEEKWFKMEGAISGTHNLSDVIHDKSVQDSDDQDGTHVNISTEGVPATPKSSTIVNNSPPILDLVSVFPVEYSLAYDEPLSVTILP